MYYSNKFPQRIYKYYKNKFFEEDKEVFEKLKESLEKFYGKERYEIKYEGNYQYIKAWYSNEEYNKEKREESIKYINKDRPFYIQIKVYYPEIEISNSKGLKHKIRDLFLKIEISKNIENYYISEFEGVRTSFTNLEIQKDYAHSHICGILSYFSKYCVGSDTPMGFWKTAYESRKRKNKFIRQIPLLIMDIDTCIRWESIEGVPYRTLSNLGLQTSDNFIFNQKTIVQLLKDNLDVFNNTQIVFEKNAISIKYNENFELSLGNIIFEKGIVSYLCNKTENGEYVNYTFDNIELNDDGKQRLDMLLKAKPLSFKGKEYNFKVIKESTNEKSDEKYPISAITKFAVNWLRQHAEENYLRNGLPKKEDRCEPIATGQEQSLQLAESSF